MSVTLTRTIKIEIDPWDSSKTTTIKVPEKVANAVKKYVQSDEYNKWLQTQKLLDRDVTTEVRTKNFYQDAKLFILKKRSSLKI